MCFLKDYMLNRKCRRIIFSFQFLIFKQYTKIPNHNDQCQPEAENIKSVTAFGGIPPKAVKMRNKYQKTNLKSLWIPQSIEYQAIRYIRDISPLVGGELSIKINFEE
jgi:hypothetical protein